MARLPKLMFSDADEVRAFRKAHRMNQVEFWRPVGITQSGGSRYETHRRIPRPVQLLLHLAYAPDDRSRRLLTVIRQWKAPKSTKAVPESSR